MEMNKTRTETITPTLLERIVGEYELSIGNGMSHETAVDHVLITVPVTHDKIMEVLKSR
jgi:hypothetical protein|tara:strand:- start:1221 stop:1397 length:177 start_codon:yes stop_codon:yes gene_type:complete